MKRGRPPQLDDATIVKAVLARKSEVLTGTGKIVSKLDNVWKVLSREIKDVIKPQALYTFVVNNRHQVKDLLNPIAKDTSIEDPNISVHNGHSSTLDSSTASSAPSVSEENDEQIINITFDRVELEDLMLKTQYSRSEKNRPHIKFRQYEILQPGKWQRAITDKLWKSCKKKCGFHFKRNKIYNGKVKICGKCNCGSVIDGTIERLNLKADTNTMRCEITFGKGTCGKIYLRQPVRFEVGKLLCETNKTAEVHRAAEANQMMSSGDPEPPHLHKAKAYRDAKKEYQATLTLHKNPVTSILLAQLSSLRYFIHNLSMNPFHVHYWSNLQTNVYKQYTLSQTSSVAIDATGSIVRKLVRPDKSKSKHIFLYTVVTNSPTSEKIPITQMLSESQTTNSISYWLMEWVRTGAPPPKEVTCDASKALLLAITRTFTNCSSVDEYADMCWGTSDMPKCYIRIDVAHFIKKYANFLKVAINPKIKTFYMALIGQLILTRTIRDAEKILYSILSIARSKTEGSLDDGQPSMCEVRKGMMFALLQNTTFDTSISEEEVAEDDLVDDVETEDIGGVNNMWSSWALVVSDEVLSESTDLGNRVNAHYLPQLADRLLKDMQWFPLWSCVCRDRFGYGRVPASSAAVESEFNNIKNRLLANEKLPMRADVFLTKHAEHIDGRMKIASAKDYVQDSVATIDESAIDEGNQQFQTKCSAGAIDDDRGGKLACTICKTRVAVSDGRSKRPRDENDQRRLLCSLCSKIPEETTMIIIDSGETENWRGQGEEEPPKKRSSRYLQSNFTQNQFILHDKIKKVPILRNGSSLTLQATTYKGKKVTVSSTCSVDSLFQIFLTTAFDSVDFRAECARLAKENLFFKMIGDTVEKGITKNTYQLRTAMLAAIFPVELGHHNTVSINCEIVIKELCRRLFKGTPCVAELSSCDEGCLPRIIGTESVSVDQTFLLKERFSMLIEEDFVLAGPSHCNLGNCVGIRTISTPTAECFIICDVNNAKILATHLDNPDDNLEAVTDILVNNSEIELSKIPRELKLSFMKKPYQLRGVIHWKPPGLETRKSDPQHKAIGHYSPICFRPDLSWVRYDDLNLKAKNLPNNFKANVHIIVYVV